ncbi:MAG TPA: LamG domain-containing protein [Acidocella sp.]|jgi:hypothetical protein|nr:LamG domain-containing protein [Acidocella sp.]
MGLFNDPRFDDTLVAPSVEAEINWNDPLAAGLVLCMPLNGNANDLCEGPAGSYYGSPLFAPSKFGQSFYAAGSNSVYVPEKPAFDVTAGTISAWFCQTATLTSYAGVFGKQSAWFLLVHGNQINGWQWGSGGANIGDTSLNTFDSKWHHAAFTFQSGVAGGSTLYVDGVAIASGEMVVSAQTSNITIGSALSGGNGQWFTGLISNALIHNRVLSAAEVARLAAEPFAMLRPRTKRQIYAAATPPSGALTGAASATSSAIGTPTGTAKATGAASVASTATGALAGEGALVGTAADVSTAAGTLKGSGALSGTAAASATATGNLTGQQPGLSATAAAAAGASGALTGSGALAAAAAGASAATGTLTAKGAAPAFVLPASLGTGIGPQIVAAKLAGATVVLTIQHDGGTDLVVPALSSPDGTAAPLPAQGVGFSVMDGGSITAPGPIIQAVACVRLDATHLQLTLASAPTNEPNACRLFYPWPGEMWADQLLTEIGRGCAITDNFGSIAVPAQCDLNQLLGAGWRVNMPLVSPMTMTGSGASASAEFGIALS